MREVLPDATRAARVPQPAPYFAIDTRHVRYVCIDTGIDGRIDPEQHRWLQRVSTEDPKPKVLLTGKPIYVNGARDETTASVDDVVRDPASRYVAAIGGDTHNYQRYTIDVGGRTVTYIVSGGGGAFMHDTHSIPEVADLPGMTEEDFGSSRCAGTPSRGTRRRSTASSSGVGGGRGCRPRTRVGTSSSTAGSTPCLRTPTAT